MTGGAARRGPIAVIAIVVVVVLVVLAALGIDLLGALGAGMSPDGAAGSAAPSTSAPSTNPGPGAAFAGAAATHPSASPASASPAGTSPASTTPTTPDPAGPSAAGRSPASQSPEPESLPQDTSSGTAPTSARAFRPTSTVVPMALPFRPATRFAFGDGFRRPRDGVVHPYDLVRGVAPNGALLRAHDGQDLLVPVGTLVVAPLAGVVVEPATVMLPWDAARYGKVVAIRSTEPESRGYVVLMAHLSRQSVAVGSSVRRGQVVGRSGRTGNAAGTLPHLHIEIRAPFLIRYGYGGVIRMLDVFDIRPSLDGALRGG
jgi:murein DD-endopeptidase MepM/ murein hydrolase activator NlpD